MNDHLLRDDHPLDDSSSGENRVVRTLTLDRPDKKNAFIPAMADALWAAIEEADADTSVRAVVLTGAGDAFCGGVDLHVFQAIASGETAGLEKLERLHEVLQGCSKPLIAAVNGVAVGMGVTLLPHFDLVYAARRASFLTPFTRLGLVLEYGSSHTLPRLIGRQRANELIFSSKPIDAHTAESWGLVTRVFPAEELLRRTLEIAAAMGMHPPGAVAASKELIRQGESGTSLEQAVERENVVLAERYGSPENLAAVAAFLGRKRA